MKISKKWIAIIICLLLSCIAIIMIVSCKKSFGNQGIFDKKPFVNLEPSEIASATVHLIPPDKTIQITDIKELTDDLNDVVIYRKDNSYTEYAGQGVTFTLTMTDGTQTEIMAYNPFLVIDGVGYKTAYEPCEVLNQYANRLLNEKDALVILEEPPMLNVISDGTCGNTLLGTYSWQRKNNDGTATGTEADSPHPLECKDLLDIFETTEATAALHFAEEPDTILNVCCWSDEHWSDSAAESENVVIDGDEIELKPGGYIYEVTAEWDTEKSGYGGTARYSFYIKVLE